MVLPLIAAWIVNSKPAEAPAAAATAARASRKPRSPPRPPPTRRPTTQVPQGEIDGLKADLKTLQDRIEALPKPAPPPDLEPLNSKIADLSKDTESLAVLPKKVDDLDQRLGSFDKTLVALRGEIDTFKNEVKKPVEPAATTPEPAKPDDTKVADAALDQGAGLFKAGKYKEASDAFQKLTESSPNDARVWYFAALSRGSATNQWTGETTRLVEKGVELEKAGSPDSAKIDAAFAELNPAFKPWLDCLSEDGQGALRHSPKTSGLCLSPPGHDRKRINGCGFDYRRTRSIALCALKAHDSRPQDDFAASIISAMVASAGRGRRTACRGLAAWW